MHEFHSKFGAENNYDGTGVKMRHEKESKWKHGYFNLNITF